PSIAFSRFSFSPVTFRETVPFTGDNSSIFKSELSPLLSILISFNVFSSNFFSARILTFILSGVILLTASGYLIGTSTSVSSRIPLTSTVTSSSSTFCKTSVLPNIITSGVTVLIVLILISSGGVPVVLILIGTFFLGFVTGMVTKTDSGSTNTSSLFNSRSRTVTFAYCLMVSLIKPLALIVAFT